MASQAICCDTRFLGANIDVVGAYENVNISDFIINFAFFLHQYHSKLINFHQSYYFIEFISSLIYNVILKAEQNHIEEVHYETIPVERTRKVEIKPTRSVTSRCGILSPFRRWKRIRQTF